MEFATQEESAMLTNKQLLKAPASEYMSDAQLRFFEQLLNDLKKKTNNDLVQCKDILSDNDLEADPLDTAYQEEVKQITLLRVQRSTYTLHKTEKALERIFSKEYGYCEETGDPIGISRLLANPIATLSIESSTTAEFKERVEGKQDDLHNNSDDEAAA